MLLDACPSRQIPSSLLPESSGAGKTHLVVGLVPYCIQQSPYWHCSQHRVPSRCPGSLEFETEGSANPWPPSPSWVKPMGFTATVGDGCASVFPMRKLLLLWAGLISLKFCVCWGEEEEGSHRRQLVPHRQQKMPYQCSNWVKCLKVARGWKASEFQLQGSLCLWAVPGQGRLTMLGVRLPHVSQWADCLCCPLDVSDRQHIPSPCSHPHPVMAGPGSSLLPFPWLHCPLIQEWHFVAAPKELILQSKPRCKSMISMFWKGQFPVFPWVPAPWWHSVSLCTGRPSRCPW